MKPIGKLLWHKAVRKTASYSAAPNDSGLVVIEVPAEFNNPYWYTFDNEVRQKIAAAIHQHLSHTATFPIPSGYKVLTKISFSMNSDPSIATGIICEMQTHRLQDWQWISTAHRFKGGEMPASLLSEYDFNP